MKPKTVGIRVLKDRLSAYVRAISQGGDELVITDRGRAVARLVGLTGATTAPRAPLHIRPAVKDRSDLSWMSKRALRSGPAVRASDISGALDFARSEKDLP